MADFIPLEEAAQTLGVTTDKLVDMLNKQEIFGYRDGGSWKFKPSEIERVQMELSDDLLDDNPLDFGADGSSLLLSEDEVAEVGNISGSSLELVSEDESASSDSTAKSDVALVPDPNSGSGVSLVNTGSDGESDLDLSLADDDADLVLADNDDLQIADSSEETAVPSSPSIDEELKLADESESGSDDLVSKGLDAVGASSSQTNEDSAAASSGSLSLSDSDGDIQLGADSGAELVLGGDNDLQLAGDSAEDISLDSGDLELSVSESASSDIDISSDLQLLAGDSNASSASSGDLELSSAEGSDVLGGDSDLAASLGSDATPVLGGGTDIAGSSGGLELDDGLELAADDEDDLVLGSGSDLALAADSGINLMSPSDSGLVLDDEPLDLGASGISGLDLAGESSAAGSDVGGSDVASASGSLVDFQQDEEFQLTPSGGVEMDDDSGSQIIELEDSADFGNDAEVALGAAAGFDADPAMMDDGGFGQEELGEDTSGAPVGAAVAYVPEQNYHLFEVLCLLLTLMVFGFSAILLSDIVRNMWGWSAGNQSSLTSSFTDLLVSGVGWKK